MAAQALTLLDVDTWGSEQDDRQLPGSESSQGGVSGGRNTFPVLNEEKDTIEDVYEPFLIQEGYLKRTPRGRTATPLAYRHLRRRLVKDGQGHLL